MLQGKTVWRDSYFTPLLNGPVVHSNVQHALFNGVSSHRIP